MKTIIRLLMFIGSLVPISVMAGNYCVYQTVDRKVTLSNQSIPPGASILRCQNWRDATDAEIAATATENRRIDAANLERDRTAAIDRLTSEIIKAKIDRAPQTEQPIYININTSTVTPPAMRHLRRGK